jgi:hypothetical protein
MIRSKTIAKVHMGAEEIDVRQVWAEGIELVSMRKDGRGFVFEPRYLDGVIEALQTYRRIL